MSLNIDNQTLIIDETAGPSDDDTLTTNATIDYMKGLTGGTAGALGTEVAIQTDFVKATADAGETIQGVSLVSSTGAAFSTTAGIDSLLTDVDGNKISLFLDPTHSNIVLGVVGNAAGGPLAFSMALVPGATTGSGDLYVVQYEAILNPLATDPNDSVNLGNTVFASVSGTKVVSFNNLNGAPSVHNDWYILQADD